MAYTKQTNEEPLLSSVGENFQYLKTIITNSIELKKLELLSTGSTAIAYIVYSFLIGFLLLLFAQVLLILSALFIYSLVGSWITSLSILSIVFLILIIAIVSYCRNFILRSVDDKIAKVVFDKNMD